MKKVLIYFNEDSIQAVGGPAGYLFNLKKGLESIKEKNGFSIEFLHANCDNNVKAKIKSLYRKLPSKILQTIQKKRTFFKYQDIINGNFHEKIDHVEQYSAIHFHSTIALYNSRDILENYNGLILLTSHTPKAPHKEIMEDILQIKDRCMEEKLAQIDRYAFNRADIIVFPCEEAEEPYYNTWEEYGKIKEKNKEKYRYILTGCSMRRGREGGEEVKRRLDISNENFIVVFIGRHNEVKGYHILQSIAKALWRKKENVIFLIAGKESPLKGLKDKRWIEYGWSDDSMSIIETADLFILPNLQTYFDLILLEVLSAGKPVLLSDTGGNRFFKKLNAKGILFYENCNSAVEQIVTFSRLNKGYRKQLGKENQKLWKLYFSEKVFAQSYLNLLADIFVMRQ